MTAPVATSPVVTAVTAAIEDVMVGDLADVAVLGPAEARQGFAERSITVGGTWDPDQGAFTADQTITTAIEESGAARLETEVTSILCIGYAGTGDMDLATHRATVGSMLAAVRTALRAITAVDGLSTQARITEQSWVQNADHNGAFALVTFTIQVVRLL